MRFLLEKRAAPMHPFLNCFRGPLASCSAASEVGDSTTSNFLPRKTHSDHDVLTVQKYYGDKPLHRQTHTIS